MKHLSLPRKILLVLAILLMLLGVIIVYTSGKELFRKKKGTETA